MKDDIEVSQKRWEETTLRKAREGKGERKASFKTISGHEIDPLYTPLNIKEMDYEQDLGFPGKYPYTRGIHETMYRGKLWTMRQLAGFGTAKDANQRFHHLLEQGQTGLSVAFDLPTLQGYDSDHARSRGEVGKVGVAIDTLEDIEALFAGIPLGKVSTSLAINAPAPILYAMYLVVAEKQGVSWSQVKGTTQNDILKEYITQKSWVFPPKPSMRLITDMMAFSSREAPYWNTVSISGYDIREAGATASQELAFAVADGMAYVQAGIEKGLNVDDFAPRLSFFFSAHNDFFEEVAKFRAARRIWARIMKERFKAKKPQSWMCRFHTQTAGSSLTTPQPYNNVVRTTLQALAAVMGGTQSLHTSSLDEILALPSEETATLALRTQQVIAEESGAAAVADPLGGSYFVETLTNEIETLALGYIHKIDQMGGMIGAIEKGYPQREIENSADTLQKKFESRELSRVGVNQYVTNNEKPFPVFRVGDEAETQQIQNLKRIKTIRDTKLLKEHLEKLRLAAQGKENVMPHILDCVRAYASIGEICDVFRTVFGEYAGPERLRGK